MLSLCRCCFTRFADSLKRVLPINGSFWGEAVHGPAESKNKRIENQSEKQMEPGFI